MKASYYDITLQTIPGRDARRPMPTTAQRVAKLEQYLEEMAAFSWTVTYRNAQAELAALKQEA